MVGLLYVVSFFKKPLIVFSCLIGIVLLGLVVFFWTHNNPKEIKVSRILYTPKESIQPYIVKLKVDWPVPYYWQEQEAVPMSEATFLIRKANSDALFTVTKLEGDSGSLLANVNRWRSQLDLAPIAKDNLKEHVDQLVLNQKRYYITKQVNTHKSVLVAIYKPSLDVTYFLKLSGEPILVSEETQGFLDVLKKAKYDDK